MDQVFASGMFEGDVALITGGGSGIGLTFAQEIGRLGAKVAICGRRQEPLDAAADVLKSAGVEVFHRTCDIRDAGGVGQFVGSVLDKFGKIDILANNAGGQFPSPAHQISAKGFEAVVRNNLLGTWTFTHAVANQAFIPQKRGRILNVIADIKRGFPGMVHTGAARAGVDNMTKTLAVEWSMFGIRVNAIAPGVILTTGTRQYPPELLHNAKKNNPTKRLGTAEEVSHLMTYLVSKYADYINGQTIYIDGGESLWGDRWFIPEDVPQQPPYEVPEIPE